MRKIIVATVATVATALSACSSDSGLTDLANETCNDLDNAIVLQVGGILGSAIADAEDLGYTGPELGDRMREECPGTMAALDSLGDEQEARDNLPNQMRVITSVCSGGGSRGTVTNNSDLTVDVFISVQYLDRVGTIIDDGLDSIDGIRPGETANWEDERYDALSGITNCRATASSVFES